MRKKAISLLLSFSLILGSTGVVSLASDIDLAEGDVDDIDIVMEDSDDPSDSSDTSAFAASTQDYSIYDQLPQGDYRVEGMNEVENPDLSGEVDEGYLTKSRYNWSKAPSITNQGNYAMDWACATIAVAGMNACKQLNYSGTSYFSELHLAYFTYNHVADAPGEISEDINEATYSDKYPNFLQRGGNRIFASNILTSWKGLASSNLYPYSKAETVLSEGLSSSDCNNQASYIEDYYEVNISSYPEDIKAVKKLIYETGAVGASFYADSYYYNPEYASYLSNVNETNHAIVLVGWDDDFSSDKFINHAYGNGAWIARNSWRENLEDGSIYDYGTYFYISYYDPSLAVQKGNSFTIKSRIGLYSSYIHHQYDGGMFTTNVERCEKAANVFITDYAEKYEVLSRISFYTPSSNVNYQIDIYSFDTTDVTDPEGGTKLFTQSGQKEYAGYHTVKLSSDTELKLGKAFSVVLTLTTPFGEPASYGAEASSEGSWYKTTTSAKAGQSFVYRNGTWRDYGLTHNANLRIKAGTDGYKNPTPTRSLEVDGPNYIAIEDSAKFRAYPSWATESTEGLAWTSSDPTILSIDHTGLATALKIGTVTITASFDGVTESVDVFCYPKENKKYQEHDYEIGVREEDDPIPVDNPDLSADGEWKPHDSDPEDPDSTAEPAEFADSVADYVSRQQYVTPDLPELRNQGSYGTCWAHASLALAEINLIKNGIFTADNVDLSELHLAYFSYNSVPDPLNGTSGDSNGLGNSYTNFLDRGGNLNLSKNILASWTGGTDEALASYDNADKALSGGLDASIAYKDKAHLINYYDCNVSTDSKDIQAVKKLIYKYGGVGIAYNPVSAYYYEPKNCYYYPRTNNASHAVIIVGWDDTFSRANFTIPPRGDGAWIVRNSWGAGKYENDNSHNYNGYFYLSYYDRSLDDSGFAFEFASADNFDNNYQYDGAMDTTVAYGSSKAANVFTSQKNETLKAVSFYTSSPDVNYEINIYTFDSNTVTNPEAGHLQCTTLGSNDFAGYRTITLSKAVDLPKGTTFSVVVTPTKLVGGAYIGAERSSGSWYKSVASAKPGQSFVYSKTTGTWSDYGSSRNANLRIKAFTKNNGSSPDPDDPDTPDDPDNPDDPDPDDPDNPEDPTLKKLTIKGPVTAIVGETANYTVVPTPAGYNLKNLIWSSSDPTILYIDSEGKASALSEGTVTLTASCDGVTATLKVACYTRSTTCYILFNANGGTGDMRNVLFIPDTDITIPDNAFTRTGYRFTGWNTEPDGTGTYYPNKATINTALPEGSNNLILYAQWRGNKYKIYFNGNGGSGTMPAISTTYGETITLPENIFTNGKRYFAGWNTEKNGTGTRYANGATVKNLTPVYNGTITLYAQWAIVDTTMKNIEVTTAGDVLAVEKGKTIQMTAWIDGVDSTKTIRGRYLIWSLVEGVGTGSATIDQQTGLLTATGEGTVKVKATSAADSRVKGLSKVIFIYISLKKASLNKTTLTMAPGTTYQLKVNMVAGTGVPTDIPTLDEDIQWSLKNSADAKYVTVDSTGLVTAVSKTKKPVTVLATFTPYGRKPITLSCKVTVKDIFIKKLKIKPKSITMREGEEKTALAVATPDTTAVTGVTWEIVSGGEYISIEPTSDYEVKITAGMIPKKKVKAKIRAISRATTAKKKPKTKTLTITIIANAASISLKKAAPERIKLKKSFTLSPVVYTSMPEVKAVNQKVTYTSSDESILKVSSSGKVTGKGRGIAEITITSKDNPDITLTIPVEVY